MTQAPPFHLAFAVSDLEATRRFYVDVLGCRVGREAARWIDFDFFGHQISAHLVDKARVDEAHVGEAHVGEARVDEAGAVLPTNPVDGKDVPVRHFGAILEWRAWHALVERLRELGVQFLIEPHIRFVGEPGEQATLFVVDPSGHALEFKSFRDTRQIFAT
ncbi:glyoxalase [Sorangium cellulosum]|uniref:Glyoxalase n=1 Tax=Sorangium cellulosum TaxID=56 RepID=A0A150R1A6_SORCE|nr:glyoxalase [Sorangium cellulosum]